MTGWLVYDSAKELAPAAEISEFNWFDDMTLVPYDRMPLLGEADQVVTVDVIMDNLGNGKP